MNVECKVVLLGHLWMTLRGRRLLFFLAMISDLLVCFTLVFLSFSSLIYENVFSLMSDGVC